jgi:peptide methionine sulfoxide reductase MsrB
MAHFRMQVSVILQARNNELNMVLTLLKQDTNQGVQNCIACSSTYYYVSQKYQT